MVRFFPLRFFPPQISCHARLSELDSVHIGLYREHIECRGADSPRLAFTHKRHSDWTGYS